MSFRVRLLLACLPLALAPLAIFGLRARAEVTARLEAQDTDRVAALADLIEDDLEREAAAVAARLDRLAQAISADNRLRLALLDRDGADRAYLLDYAGSAMPVTGLDLLRIQDERGRVVSSGHFRNEYDAVDPALPAALAGADARGALVVAPTAAGPMLALARARSLRVGARTFTLVGGTSVDDRFLDRLGRGTGLEVRLQVPADDGPATAGVADGTAPSTRARAGDTPPPGRATPRPSAATRPSRDGVAPPGYAREVVVPFVGAGADTVAHFVVRASTGPLDAIRREMDRWLVATLAAAAGFALLLALVVSARLGRPIADLAHKAGRVDLDRLDVAFATGRSDEIGTLSRVLDRMTGRIRASAARLREAERRATIGEVARQVNHDIRNGLIPIRHVLSHLAELAREQPDELPAVFRERQRTLESSIEYLHALAANYARLSPRLDARPCDLNAIVRDAVREGVGGDRDAADPAGGRDASSPGGAGAVAGPGGAGGDAAARVVMELAPRLPPVRAEAVALRRIVENLVVNALESLEGGTGRVVVSTRLDPAGEPPRILLSVADSGHGMSAEERARIFEAFYTTRPGGTGLGLSIVRRLVSDMGGRVAVESEPGRGSRFTIELPATAGTVAEDDARSAAAGAARKPETTP